MGREAYVPEERYLDAVTALSGSGPAYVFLFIEALIDAGVHVGLARDLATTMALQTVLGSARYMQQTGRPAAELRGQVTSPAGTTAAALRAMEAGGLRSTILEGVIAAYERSKALGEAAH
jgi:pyrroline-5-carboxylate reductase